MRSGALALVLALLIATAGSAVADDDLRTLAAVRTAAAPFVDGALDDVVWSDAPVGGAFVIQYPGQGESSGHATDVRVVYDDHALYVGLRAHDSDDGGVRRVLTRRDLESEADWLLVGIDSIGDRRTSFVFAVNAAGVQRDYKIANDTDIDPAWNAVWASAVQITDDGWSAELRIPLSQLRFTSRPESWGLQVTRVVAHTGEKLVWSPSPYTEQRTVSRYGRLTGVDGLHAPRSLELKPYAVMGGDLADATGMELRDDVELRYGAGLDASYALGRGLTLTATINPDFGQVEADPSQVNLSDSELFFPERRPFFVEGAEMFGADLGGVETLFYSRRVGAAPHGDASADAVEVRQPAETTILAAAKLSGRTAGGWKIAALDAVGSAEHADVRLLDGSRATVAIEPLTNFGVARVAKAIHDNNGSVGALVTTTHRQIDDAAMMSLHDRAYSGAVDAELSNAGGTWRAVGMLAGTYVAGSREAIEATQRSSVRYFQRTDAPHVELDPDRTRLAGAASHAAVEKLAGSWTGELRSQMFTPGFEPNDLGFLQLADAGTQSALARKDVSVDHGPVATYSATATASLIHDFEPRIHAWTGGLDGGLTLRNLWELQAGVSTFVGRWNRSITRGNVLMRVDPSYQASLGVASDPRKSVRADLSAYVDWSPVGAGQRFVLSPSVTIAPRSNLQIELGARMAQYRDAQQYVDSPVDRAGVSHDVVGALEQKSASATVRVEYTWSPSLSLQMYARPYLTSGAFSEYREVAAPRARAFDERFVAVAAGAPGEVIAVDRDGDGTPDYELADASFDWRSLQSTMVLRWEYRPGSSLSLIWNHNRASLGDDGQFALGDELSALADTAGAHVVLLKADYWLDR